MKPLLGSAPSCEAFSAAYVMLVIILRNPAISAHPFGRIPAVVVRCWESMLWGKSILHIDSDET
jgi:hypothetical protein